MTTHVGTPSHHDSQLCKPTTPDELAPCEEGRYVGRHTAAYLADRRRKARRGHLSDAHEARKADLLGEVAALPVLRVVEGGAG